MVYLSHRYHRKYLSVADVRLQNTLYSETPPKHIRDKSCTIQILPPKWQCRIGILIIISDKLRMSETAHQNITVLQSSTTQ